MEKDKSVAIDQVRNPLRDELRNIIQSENCILCTRGSEVEWRLTNLEKELYQLQCKELTDMKDINTKLELDLKSMNTEWGNSLKDVYIKWDRLNTLIIGTLVTAVMTLIGVIALFLKG